MSFLLAILKSGRFWAAAGVIAAVVTFATWAWNERWEAGYNAAELEWRKAQQAAVDKAVAEARANWEGSVEAAEENVRVETEIVERVRVVEREVPKIVERVVRPDCRDLGPDIRRVYNDAIRAANNLPGPGAGAAAESDDEVR